MKISSKKLKERLGAGWEIESIEEAPKPKEKPLPRETVSKSIAESSTETKNAIVEMADVIIKRRIDEHLKSIAVEKKTKEKSRWIFTIYRNGNGFAQSVTATDENSNNTKWDFKILRDRDGFIGDIVATEN